ncbi:MAG: hypothetical protein HYT08_04805 [Candidatus Levybacteria bacterium]|nr:hypothetical protein [Candidatus Levybacteria bacterium]
MSNYIEKAEGENRNQVTVDKSNPNGIWVINATIHGEKVPPISVFNIRNNSHKPNIAKALVSGDPVCAFGIGNYGLAIGIEDPRRGRTPHVWEGWWKFKPERPSDNKVPMLLPWKHWSRVIDKRKTHPKVRPLFEYENLQRLFREGIVFHVKAETFDIAPHIDSRAFIQVENGKRMVSVLLWDDPDLYEVADLAYRQDPQVIVGISSYNPHGENPAFTFEEVIDQIKKTGRIGFKYCVRDSLCEGFVKSSMAIFVVEGDHFYEQRRGSISAERFLAATHLNTYIRTDAEPNYAGRDHPKEEMLDSKVELIQKLAYRDRSLRKRT